MGVLTIFLYLQLLDFLTTVLFLKLGLTEGNWLVAALMGLGPILGLTIAKVLTILLALVAVHYQKIRAMRVVNMSYCAVIVWNLSCMILAPLS